MRKPLRISVDNHGWEPPFNTRWNHGKGIKHIVETTAIAIGRHCRNTSLDPIVVYHRSDNPQADWPRGAKGEIRVGLCTGGTAWAQFAFQFSHEFSHVLANQAHDPSKLLRNMNHSNFWLEECLSETGSYFALRSLAATWKNPTH